MRSQQIALVEPVTKQDQEEEAKSNVKMESLSSQTGIGQLQFEKPQDDATTPPAKESQ